jgi:hypothetical protein
MYHNKNQNFTYRAGARGEDGLQGGREGEGWEIETCEATASCKEGGKKEF